MMKSYPGRFISFEGGDGTGKTTQIKRLKDVLEARGIAVVTTREPGGTAGAEEIRALLVTGETNRWDALTETLLLFAARHDHIEKIIRPALEKGAWVISDRFADSTYAYQGFGGGLNRETIRRIESVSIQDFKPDQTFILDMDPADGIARTKARADAAADGAAESRYEHFDLAFHQRLRQGYLDIARRSRERCAVIAADRDADAVTGDILDILKERFGIS